MLIVEKVCYKTELGDSVWDDNCDTAVSDEGTVATIPTELKAQWLLSKGYTDSDKAIWDGWALVTFIGHIDANRWHVKIVVPDITKEHIVFAEVRQYIINKLTWLDEKYGPQHLCLFSPAIDVQVYCDKSQTIQRVKNVAFWLKTGHLHKNGLTQLSEIVDNENID